MRKKKTETVADTAAAATTATTTTIKRVNKYAIQQPRYTSSGGNVQHSTRTPQTLPANGQRLLALNALLSVAIK